MKKVLADALSKRGYDTLTPVQTACIDPELGAADLLVSAQTGSGKTVGFGLALGETLLGDQEHFERADAPLALVIAPTRELAMQVKRELAWLYAEAGVVMASCVGGMEMRDERRALARGAHIVVATPGRLRDHIMRSTIDLSAIRAVVLDEADEMLDLGFREDLEFILEASPEARRTLMFSATVPKAIANLATRYQRDAVRVETLSGAKQHSDIEYLAMQVANHDSENAIINILRYYDAPNSIVFCNTRAMVNRVTTRLSNRGFAVVALSGELSQNERTHALQAMRDGRARVCVATDVAARGIDLPGLDLVVHADLPKNHETMLHRSGRTGRAGRKGVSALIVTPKLRRKLERVLQSAKVNANWTDAPSAQAVRERDQSRLLEDPVWQEEIGERDQEMVERLTNAFSPTQLAAAYLRLYNTNVSAPEELSAVNDKSDKPRQSFGPSTWFSVKTGRDQGAMVGRLLPILCNSGGITKDDIGAIRIQNDETYVEILKTKADGFKSTLGAGMTIEGGVKVEELAKAPNLPKSAKPRFDKKGPGKFDRDKPAHRKGGGADRGPKRDSAPTDWNDAPAPKKRKPKPESKGGDAPKKSGEKYFQKPKTVMDKAREDGAVVTRKPREKSKSAEGAGKPKFAAPKVKGKKSKSPAAPGLAPKVGKTNSKKNKARRAAAAETSKKGGTQPPRRG